MTSLTRLYGLAIRSAGPLHQHRPVPADVEVDHHIELGYPITASAEVPDGRVLLPLPTHEQLYVAVADADGYLLRFFDTCDIRLDRALTRATIAPVEGTDPTIVSVLAGGTLLAFVLAMRGEPVLHGSAVQLGEQALAFVGASGMGKSTMATLQAADGAGLITDDLLRLDLSRTPPGCALGATELRLRKAAGELAGRFELSPGRRTTGDDREALAPLGATTEGLPLAAIVVPFPDKSPDKREPEVQRLDQMAAFLMLSQFPRLLGWQDPEVLQRQFQQLGEVVERVPVYAAGLPWGPPFPDRLAAQLRAAIGLA